ncbi:hypothetical protein [Branchiibius cervicis]|uniref:Uncharacterized protein n=1 Tax=Branchiibius cervicis TaxID=908252 RepID=A0ABW2AWJ2_9MICO
MNTAPQRRKVYRSPNIVAFLVTGAVIGIILGAIVGASGDSGDYTDWSAIGYLAVVFGSLGALLGGVAAVLADWWAHR